MKKSILVVCILALSIGLKAQDSVAHDRQYQIGYTIGQYLPFVVLVGFGWLVYRSVKKRADDGDTHVP
jgi:Kef-type K+ transport system membrane component KefB